MCIRDRFVSVPVSLALLQLSWPVMSAPMSRMAPSAVNSWSRNTPPPTLIVSATRALLFVSVPVSLALLQLSWPVMSAPMSRMAPSAVNSWSRNTPPPTLIVSATRALLFVSVPVSLALLQLSWPVMSAPRSRMAPSAVNSWSRNTSPPTLIVSATSALLFVSVPVSLALLQLSWPVMSAPRSRMAPSAVNSWSRNTPPPTLIVSATSALLFVSVPVSLALLQLSWPVMSAPRSRMAPSAVNSWSRNTSPPTLIVSATSALLFVSVPVSLALLQLSWPVMSAPRSRMAPSAVNSWSRNTPPPTLIVSATRALLFVSVPVSLALLQLSWPVMSAPRSRMAPSAVNSWSRNTSPPTLIVSATSALLFVSVPVSLALLQLSWPVMSAPRSRMAPSAVNSWSRNTPPPTLIVSATSALLFVSVPVSLALLQLSWPVMSAPRSRMAPSAVNSWSRNTSPPTLIVSATSALLFVSVPVSLALLQLSWPVMSAPRSRMAPSAVNSWSRNTPPPTLIVSATSALLFVSVPVSLALLQLSWPVMSAPRSRMAPSAVNSWSRNTSPPTLIVSATSALLFVSVPVSLALLQLSWPVMSAPRSRMAPSAVNSWSRNTPPPTLIVSATSALLFVSVPVSLALLQLSWPVMSAPRSRMAPSAVNSWSRNTPPPTLIVSATRALLFVSVPVSLALLQLSWPVMSAPRSRMAPSAVNSWSRNTPPPTLIVSATRALLFVSVPVSLALLQLSWPVMSAPMSRMAPAAVNPSSRNTPPPTLIVSATRALLFVSVPVSLALLQLSWPVMSAPRSRMAPSAVNSWSRNTPPPTLIVSATRALLFVSVPVSLALLQLSWPVMSAPMSRMAPAAVNPSSRNTPPPTLIVSATRALLFVSVPVSLALLQLSWPVMSAPRSRMAPSAVNSWSRNTPPPTLIVSATRALLFVSVPVSLALLQLSWPVMSAPMSRMAPAAVNPSSRNTPPPTLIVSATRALLFVSVPVSLALLQLSWPVMSAPMSRMAPSAVNSWSRNTPPPTLIVSATSALLFVSVPVSLALLQLSWPLMSAPRSRMAPSAVNSWSRTAPPPTLIVSATSALLSVSVPVSLAPLQMSWPLMSAPDSRMAPVKVDRVSSISLVTT